MILMDTPSEEKETLSQEELDALKQEETKKVKEEALKKVKEGWIHGVMMIEVLAVTEDAAKSALDKHVLGLNREKKTLVFRSDFQDIQKIENPLPNTPVGYSNIVEVEFVVQNFEKLIHLVMNYGPSATEILHPREIRIDMGDAQGILNSVADVIHKFTQQGLGGIIVRS